MKLMVLVFMVKIFLAIVFAEFKDIGSFPDLICSTFSSGINFMTLPAISPTE